MNIQGYQKMTLLDYPGKVACTVFTGGCNLRCPFCHNAGLVNTPHAGKSMETEVLDYLRLRRGILDGVCITGGEPLLQPDLAEFIGRVKELGLCVKLDTNGSLPKHLQRLISTGLLDYIAMDVKSSPEGYARATGSEFDFSLFEESIALLKASGIPHEFRTTAVKGIHVQEDLLQIARLIGDEPYFIQRFVDSGNLLDTGCSAFDEAESAELLRIVQAYTPRAALRGID